MKKIIILVVIVLVLAVAIFLFAGSLDEDTGEVINQPQINENVDNQQNEEKTLEEGQEEIVEDVFDLNAVIQECDSLCNVDSDAYCSQERTIEFGGEQLTGTCRAFAKKGAVDGFNRCEGFCEEYPKSTSNIN